MNDCPTPPTPGGSPDPLANTASTSGHGWADAAGTGALSNAAPAVSMATVNERAIRRTNMNSLLPRVFAGQTGGFDPRCDKARAMAEAGFWVAWGLPTHGREVQALDLLTESRRYLERLAQDGAIERFDVVILKPQTTELGGFFLVQGTHPQVDALRHDDEFRVWVNRVQLVADRVAIVDAWVGEGIDEASDLYAEALRKAGLSP